MSTAISIPQEPAFIPDMRLPAEVEGATAGIEAPAKRRILDCPEALKSLDKNAEDRWKQLSRIAMQDVLNEFATDELIFRLQCQGERERRSNLPYDDNARTIIWDAVACRLGVKVRFSSSATVERTSPHPGEDLRKASTLSCITKDVDTYAKLIARLVPTLTDQKIIRLRAVKLLAHMFKHPDIRPETEQDIVFLSELADGDELPTEEQVTAMFLPAESKPKVGRKKVYKNAAERQRACRARKRLSRNTPETVENGLGA